MVVTDCYWEIPNIGTKTAEVSINNINEFDKEKLIELEDTYSYLVVKTPINDFKLSGLLSQIGYQYIESQFYISKRFKTFDVDDRLIKTLLPHISIERITSKNEFEQAMERITPGMFSTDRIAIDPYFGMEKSRNRYVNWMRTEFEKQQNVFIKFYYYENNVGVGMHKLQDGTLTGLVGGVYEKFKDEGLGMLTPAAPFFYALQGGDSFKKMVTCISSNNMPVIQVYNYLGFKMDDIKYVFIKHV